MPRKRTKSLTPTTAGAIRWQRLIVTHAAGWWALGYRAANLQVLLPKSHLAIHR